MRWLAAGEISELMDQVHAVRMLDALADGPPAIRSHDGITVLVEEE